MILCGQPRSGSLTRKIVFVFSPATLSYSVTRWFFEPQALSTSEEPTMRTTKKTAEKQESLEKQLWSAADKLRKNIDAAEYKHKESAIC